MPKPHHRQEFIRAKAVARWLQEDRCLNCDSFTLNAQVHHLDHDNTNNSLNNLAVLCKGCHDLYHLLVPMPPISRKQMLFFIHRKRVDFMNIPE